MKEENENIHLIGYTLRHAKRFFNHYHIILKLSYQERYLLDYLVEHADEDGSIKTGQDTIQGFINFILRISHFSGEEILYKASSVKHSVHRLKELNLLISNPDKFGFSWVNPLYNFRGNQEKRRNMINYINSKLYDHNLESLQDRGHKVFSLEKEVVQQDDLQDNLY